MAAVQALEQGDAEAELIRAGVRGLAAELLGRHVARGAADEVAERVRGLGAAALLEPARQAEVGDAHAVGVVDEDVLGLEVAVGQAVGVGVDQGAASLAEDLEDRGPGALPALDPVAQGLAVDDLHGDVGLLLVEASLVDLDDVGVIEPGHGAGLGQEALLGAGGVLVAAGAVQELDRGGAIEVGVAGSEDHAHAAAANLVADDEAADAGAGSEVDVGAYTGR